MSALPSLPSNSHHNYHPTSTPYHPTPSPHHTTPTPFIPQYTPTPHSPIQYTGEPYKPVLYTPKPHAPVQYTPAPQYAPVKYTPAPSKYTPATVHHTSAPYVPYDPHVKSQNKNPLKSLNVNFPSPHKNAKPKPKNPPHPTKHAIGQIQVKDEYVPKFASNHYDAPKYDSAHHGVPKYDISYHEVSKYHNSGHETQLGAGKD